MTSKAKTGKHPVPGCQNDYFVPNVTISTSTSGMRTQQLQSQPATDEALLKNLKVSYQSIKFLFPNCKVQLSSDEWKCKVKQIDKIKISGTPPLVAGITKIGSNENVFIKQEVMGNPFTGTVYVDDKNRRVADGMAAHSTWEDKFIDVEWETGTNETKYSEMLNQSNISVQEILVLKPKWLEKDCKKVIFRDFHVNLSEVGRTGHAGNKNEPSEFKDPKQEITTLNNLVVKHPFNRTGNQFGTTKPIKLEHTVETTSGINSNLSVKVESSNLKDQYRCELCSNSFASKLKLFHHILGHTGEKPYRCEICGKRFRSRQNTRAHIQSHSSETSFQCQTCYRRFKWKGSLNRHLVLLRCPELRRNPSVCQTGDQSIKRGEQLKTQENHMHTTKNYKCKYCEDEFNHEYKLKMHIGLVHNIKRSPYQCRFCQYPFSNTFSLNRHVKLGRCEGSRK